VEFEPLPETIYNAGVDRCVVQPAADDRSFFVDNMSIIQEFTTFPLGGDYAVFRTKRNALTGLSAFEQQGAALPLATFFASPVLAYKYGYGAVGSPDFTEPSGPDFGPCTCRAGDPLLPQSFRQRQGFGSLLPIAAGNELRYDIHTCVGDSGAPILVNGVGVVAIHSGNLGTIGGCNFNPTTGTGVPYNNGTKLYGRLRADIARLCPIDPQGDHYLCYGARDDRPRQDPPDVTLRDQFYTAQYDVKPASLFCTPADKNEEGIVDDVTHLKRYPIERLGSGSPPEIEVLVKNQFGDLRIRVKRESDLMVPTAKSLTSTPPEPDPKRQGHQHYKCYKVKKVITAHPEGQTVTVTDQFGTLQLGVGKPLRLCNPVAKNGQAPHAPDRHLMCYKVQSNFRPPSPVFVNNQFGPEVLDLRKPKEFCVPSGKIPVCGDGFCDDNEDGTTTGCPQDCGCASGPGWCGTQAPGGCSCDGKTCGETFTCCADISSCF
jgi:hypothetical protein